jgi:hypothetical protein
MQKYLLSLVAAVFTFALGTFLALSAHWAPSYSFDSNISGPGPVAVEDNSVPRFQEWGRGCGNGYVQSYNTDDGQMVSEGVISTNSRRHAKREFAKELQAAERIVQRAKNYRDFRGELGERVVLANKGDESGDNWVSILFYDGGDSFSYINAPTLELALEFEQFLTIEEHDRKRRQDLQSTK